MVCCPIKGIERPHGDGPRPVSGPEGVGGPDGEGAGGTPAGHGDGCGRTTGGGGVVGRGNDGGGRAALEALAARELRRRPRAEDYQRYSRGRAAHGHRHSGGQRGWDGPMSWARRHVVHSCFRPRWRWVLVLARPRAEAPVPARSAGGGRRWRGRTVHRRVVGQQRREIERTGAHALRCAQTTTANASVVTAPSVVASIGTSATDPPTNGRKGRGGRGR